MSKYIVKLDAEQRGMLEQQIRSGQASTRKLMHARILLKADDGEHGPNWPDTQISQALEVSIPTIWRVRRRSLVDRSRNGLISASLMERKRRISLP